MVHDEDPIPALIPENWDENKIKSKKRTFELNLQIADLVENLLGSVEVFSPDIEEASRVPKTLGDRKGKPLAALEHFADKKCR